MIAPQQPASTTSIEGTAEVTANAVITELKVGDDVAHADPYTVAYRYHGVVEQVTGDDILVRWAERQGKHNEMDTEQRRFGTIRLNCYQ